MIEEVIFVTSVGWFAWKGFRSGVGKMLLGVGVLAVSYLSTFFFSPDLTDVLLDDYNFSYIQANIGAALIVFFGTFFFLNTTIMLIGKVTGQVTYIDASIRGAILGSVFGAIIGLFLAWAGGVMVTSIAEQKKVPQLIQDAESKPGPIEKISKKVVNKAVETAIKTASPEANERVVEASAALISDPVKVTKQINNLVSNTEFNSLMQNPVILASLNNQDSEGLSAHPDFVKLVQHPDVRHLTTSLGLAEGKKGEEEFAEAMITAWNRVEEVRNTPRFQELMQDPEVREILQSQNPVNIISNPKANELLKVILNPEGSANPQLERQIQQTMDNMESMQAADVQAPAYTAPEEEPGTRQYWRWTDENGRINFSEKQPEGVDAELIDY